MQSMGNFSDITIYKINPFKNLIASYSDSIYELISISLQSCIQIGVSCHEG